MIKDIEKFRDKGLVSVPYPSNLKKVVSEVAESWKLFCGLPKEVKEKFEYILNVHDGTGYEIKDDPSVEIDLKENFHVSLGELGRFRSTAKDIEDERTTHFIRDVENLMNKVEPFVVDFIEKVEKTYNLRGFKDECLEGKDMWVFRYLHYFKSGKSGKELAAPHCDRGGFTLHLYESVSGLEYLGYDGESWNTMPISLGETVIIPGMQLQMRSEGELKALCHKVKSNDISAKEGRFSAVLFVDFPHTARYNKKAYGMLKRFGPGFNYTMPFSEFSKLFHFNTEP